jgi:hypothetical protein
VVERRLDRQRRQEQQNDVGKQSIGRTCQRLVAPDGCVRQGRVNPADLLEGGSK